MIKRAQRRFALSAMGAMGFCVLALIAAINIVNYVQQNQQLDHSLREMVAAVEAVLDAQAQAEEQTAEPSWRVESYVEEVTEAASSEEARGEPAESGEEPGPEDGQDPGDSEPSKDGALFDGQKDMPLFFGDRGGRPGKWGAWWEAMEEWQEAQEDNDRDEAPPEVTPEERIINHYYYYYEDGTTPDLRNTALNQYAGRFFIVTFPEGKEAVADMSSESALITEAAISLAQDMVDSGSDRGYLDNYRYMVKTIPGGTRVYFLDCSTERKSLRNLLLLSCLVGLGGLMLAFLFVVRMSRKAVEPLKESMDRQKRFITDAGHELKTPLAVIGTNMDILTMDIGENEWISGTQRQLRRLRKLVANLISLSKLEESSQDAELQPVDLSETAAECADSFVGMAELEGKELRAEIAPGVRVTGDLMTLGQLMNILCDNAVKYSQGDGVIQVRLYTAGKKAFFETENDWAHTVPPQELEHLFDRFYRGDASRGADTPGYGLGLSIAKAIAEKNRAQLTVRENDQGRLVFQVVLHLES